MRGIEELKVDPSDRAKLLKSWIPQADLCSWTPCVQCKGRIARAGINLDFSFEKPLTGRLPAAWGAIGQTLRSINLRYDEVGLATGRSDKNESCRLASPYIPQIWSNLTRATLVRLSNLGLQGVVPVHIFADMPNLRFLTLANNQFTALPAPAPGEFKALTAVDLSYNMLGQSALPELEVGALPALESLNLGYNMLRGKVPSSYGAALKRLVVLGLEGNQLDTLDLGQQDYPNLAALQIAHNQLSGKMPDVLLRKRLALADFRHNSLTALPDTWWHNMPRNGRGRVNNLLEVFASHNKISGSLPPLMSAEGANGSFMLAADLSFNDLSGSIWASGKTLGATRHGFLIASHNRLTGKLPPSLMHWFSGAVDLSHNMLSGSCCPEAWHQWDSLRGLYLEHNMLRGPLPSIYSNWSALRVLDLASNPLNTTVPSEFLGTNPRREFGQFVDGPYCEVYLNNCSLQGTLPSAWLNNLLIQGRALAIHDNPNLEGCLPPAMCVNHTYYCTMPEMQLVSRNSSCTSCFVADALQYNPVGLVGLARYDCDQVDPLVRSFIHSAPNGVVQPQHVPRCDTWIAWPNATGASDGACTGSWCAAIAGTRVTGVCHGN